MTKGAAIRQFCFFCRNVDGHRDARYVTENCPNKTCPLWPFRPVMRPDKRMERQP
jgi:hypothetical protein